MNETAASKLPAVYDLQEPFRWLVDLSVVETIAGRGLDRKADFITTENHHVKLRPYAISLLAERLSENFNRAIPFGGQRRTFEAILFETVRKLARHLLGQSKRLDLSFPFGAFDGVVDSETAESIPNLSAKERKALCIRANTFHYLKRRAADGKLIRIYGKVAQRPSGISAEH